MEELSQIDEQLIGRRISSIKVGVGYGACRELYFILDNGLIWQVVAEGDCCSHAYIHDIFGQDKLIGPIVQIQKHKDSTVDHEEDEDCDDFDYGVVDILSFSIVTEHPIFGEVTTHVQGRCEHNGYYFGWFDHDIVDELPTRTTTYDISMNKDSWSMDEIPQ